MIHIDYDILFSVQSVLEKENSADPILIYPENWQFYPSSSTLKMMRNQRMLFKQIGGQGLMLMEPTEYMTETVGGVEVQKAVFHLEAPIVFTIEARLEEKSLLRDINLGPDPTSDDSAIPIEKRQFFERAFPGKRPTYVLKNTRLTNSSNVIGHEDAIALPSQLSFNKARFSGISLKGPLPGLDEIPPDTLSIFEDGEIKEIENASAFEFSQTRLSEAVYELSGSKIETDLSESPFSGQIFIHKGNTPSSPVAYLQIEIPAGETKSGDRQFFVNINQK